MTPDTPPHHPSAATATALRNVDQTWAWWGGSVVAAAAGTLAVHLAGSAWAALLVVQVVVAVLFGARSMTALRGSSHAQARLAAAMHDAAAGRVDLQLTTLGPCRLRDVAGGAQALVDRLRHVHGTVSDSLATLAEVGEQVLAASRQMSDTAEDTAARATASAATAEQVSGNVHLVAAATEELAATIREVAVHAHDAMRVARGASEQAVAANATVAQLSSSTQRVESVVELIQSIAGQTHLLALNATIEAARAGESGRGFSVVADEVKSLAVETANATRRATASVQDIQAGSGQAGRVIDQITATIERVSQNQTAIATAVEEQTATTKDIGRGAAEAAFGSSFIADNISMLAEGARVAAYSGARCRSTAAEIAGVRRQLEQVLEGGGYGERQPAVSEAWTADGVISVPHGAHGTGLHEFDFRGTWCQTPAGPTEDGGTCSSLPGDSVRLLFKGTQVTLFGITDANFGLATVAVDGEVTELDFYSPVRTAGAQLWASPVLPFGEHTLTLTIEGRMNAASRYLWVGLQRAEVRAEPKG